MSDRTHPGDDFVRFLQSVPSLVRWTIHNPHPHISGEHVTERHTFGTVLSVDICLLLKIKTISRDILCWSDTYNFGTFGKMVQSR